MLNIGSGEVLVILVVALIVLGPTRLPEAVRQVSRALGEIRRLSAGFQDELQSAMDGPLEESARERGRQLEGDEHTTARDEGDEDSTAGDEGDEHPAARDEGDPDRVPGDPDGDDEDADMDDATDVGHGGVRRDVGLDG